MTAQLGARGNEQVIQAEFEVAMYKSRESNGVEHLAERLDRNSLLVFVALHFVADKMPDTKHRKDRIDQRRWPSQDQRAARRRGSCAPRAALVQAATNVRGRPA